MPYSKPRFRSCNSKAFLNSECSICQCSPLGTVLYVPAKRVASDLASFISISDYVTLLWNTSLLIQVKGFYDVRYRFCTLKLYARYFFNISIMKNTWSIGELVDDAGTYTDDTQNFIDTGKFHFAIKIIINFCTQSIGVGFKVLTEVVIGNVIFWDTAPCGRNMNRRFGGTSVHIRTTRHYIPEDDNFQFIWDIAVYK